MQSVICEIEERNRELFPNGVLFAETHTIENGPRIEHAAEGTNQIKKCFWCETHQITTGVNRFDNSNG